MSDAQEIFNPTGSDLTLSSYAIGHVTNGGDGTNYQSWCASLSCQSHLLLCSIGIFLSRPSSPDVHALGPLLTPCHSVHVPHSRLDFTAGATIASNGLYVICHPDASAEIQAFCDQTYRSLSNGDDGFCLLEGTEDSYTQLDCIGDWGDDPGSSFDVCGAGDTKDNTIVRNCGTASGNAGDWAGTTTAENCEWAVYAQNYWDEGGYHTSCAPIDSVTLSPVDCVGSWSACTADCGDKTYTVETAAADGGAECAAAAGDAMTCTVGDGDCVESAVEGNHCGEPSTDCNLFIAEVRLQIYKRTAQPSQSSADLLANSRD